MMVQSRRDSECTPAGDTYANGNPGLPARLVDALQQRPRIALALALVAIAALAIQTTWPFAEHPSDTVVGPVGYDTSSSIGKFGAIAREGTTPFSSGVIESIAAPNGVRLTPGLDAVSAFSSVALWIGARTIGSIPTHGLMSVVGLFLSGAVTLLFVRWCTRSTWAGLLAGAAVGFFPHLRLIANAAPTYTHVWLYVLPLWAFCVLVRDPRGSRALLAGASAVPAIFWTPYYTAHVLVELLACGLVSAVVFVRSLGWLRTGRIAARVAAPVAAALVIYLGIGVLTAFADVPARDPADFYLQAAHPLMYVVPGYAAWLWGHEPYDVLVEYVPHAAQTNLYLGLSVISLAVAGLVVVLRAGRTGNSVRPPGSQRARVAGTLALAVALAAVAWSLPPTIGLAGIDVPMPSQLTMEITPAIRAGQRFVMLAMPAAAVLAGIGAAALLGRIRPVILRGLVAILAVAVVRTDHAVRADPPTRVPITPALRALAGAPPGLAIHYQNADPGGLLVGAVARPCVLQQYHRHALVNACNLTLEPAVVARLYELGDPASCKTMRALQRLGVRYVLADVGVDLAHCDRFPRLTVLAADPSFRLLRLSPL